MLSPSSLQSSVGSSKQNLDYRSDIEKLTSLCKELKPSLQDKKNLQISHREYLQDEINTLEKKMKETNNMNHDLKEQLSFKDRELEVLNIIYCNKFKIPFIS